MRIQGERTNSTTGVVTIQEHTASLKRNRNTEWWLYLDPGVTGHESISLKDLMDPYRKIKGWCACAGTPNSWDKLMVPESELERIRDVIRLTPL